MSTLGAQAIYYVTSIIVVVLIHLGYTQVFSPKARPRWIVLCYVVYLIWSTQQFFEFHNPWYNLLVNVGSILLLSRLYSGNSFARIVLGIMIYIAVLLADLLSYAGLNFLYHRYYGADMPAEFIYSVHHSVMALATLFLLFVCTRIFKMWTARGTLQSEIVMPGRYKYTIFLMLTGIIVLDCLYFLISIRQSPINYTYIVITQLLTFVIATAIMYLYNTLVDYLSEQARNQVMDQELRRWAMQYQAMLDSQAVLATHRHNTEYHYLGLAALLQQGKADKALEQIAAEIGDLKRAMQVVRTGNIAIDTILNDFDQKIRGRLGIELELELAVPADIDPDPVLLSLILGNALQNAIEASEAVPVEERFIKLAANVVQKRTRSLQVVIANAYLHEPRTDHSGRLETIKADTRQHGLGLAAIQAMLTPEQGQIDLAYENHRFQFSLIMYNL